MSETRESQVNVLMERLLFVLSPLALLALWEIGATLQWIDTRFFPAPSVIFKVFGDMIASG